MGKTAELAVQDDHSVDDVPAVNASQGKDPGSSLVHDLRHSQPGTAGALHDILLGYMVVNMETRLGSLLNEVAPGACPFSWQEGTSAGSQVREGGAAGLRGVGVAVAVSGIGLISGGFLFDEGETGNAVERIRLHFEPGRGDLLTAVGTDSVRTRMQGRERLLNPAKLFDTEKHHGQGDI